MGDHSPGSIAVTLEAVIVQIDSAHLSTHKHTHQLQKNALMSVS